MKWWMWFLIEFFAFCGLQALAWWNELYTLKTAVSLAIALPLMTTVLIGSVAIGWAAASRKEKQ